MNTVGRVNSIKAGLRGFAGRFFVIGLALTFFGTLGSMPAQAHVPVSQTAEKADSVPGSSLDTPWTGQVRPDNALVEYPRPQLVRKQWQNLNGLWDYLGQNGGVSNAGIPKAGVSKTSVPKDDVITQPQKTDYREQILVPYPPESKLSRIARHDDVMWYRKDFQVSPEFLAQDSPRQDSLTQGSLAHGRVLLHFGAVDQTATVWVNGKQVARHSGGYTAFSADITDALRPGQQQELVVRAEDRSESGEFPVGKQRSKPGGIFYTGSSGIWQTVWLEPVPATYVDSIAITPSLSAFSIKPQVVRASSAHKVEVIVSGQDGVELARANSGPKAVASKGISPKNTFGETFDGITVAIPHPRLWTPDDPWLYNLTVRVLDANGAPVDEVKSYAGLRTVETVQDGQGRPRIALNGKITFLHGPLDQGFWPDGLYTAPTDEALRSDLVRTKELGFNFVRKHVKVEPARWYYWADKLGLLVWQDMPSLTVSLDGPARPKPDPEQAARDNYRSELSSMIDQLGNAPSIIGWVPFNEGWGEFDTSAVAASVKEQDHTRLVIASSGVNCCFSRTDTGAGDVYDDHTYVGPGHPAVKDYRSIVDGEYGGLGLVVADHVWPGRPNAYEMTVDSSRLTKRYVEVSEDLERVVRETGLSGAIYTQLTDVEDEVNGFLTYDRQVEKMDFSLVAQRNKAVIAAGSH
jgi:hypothetical protein